MVVLGVAVSDSLLADAEIVLRVVELTSVNFEGRSFWVLVSILGGSVRMRRRSTIKPCSKCVNLTPGLIWC